MLKKRRIRVNRLQDRSCLPLSISGNPLWPLEELRNLHTQPVVAEAELTPLAIDALGGQAKEAFAADLDTPQVKRRVERHSFVGRTEFRIPLLVHGMPWRFQGQSGCRIVPDPEFVSLDLSFLSRD